MPATSISVAGCHAAEGAGPPGRPVFHTTPCSARGRGRQHRPYGLRCGRAAAGGEASSAGGSGPADLVQLSGLDKRYPAQPLGRRGVALDAWRGPRAARRAVRRSTPRCARPAALARIPTVPATPRCSSPATGTRRWAGRPRRHPRAAAWRIGTPDGLRRAGDAVRHGLRRRYDEPGRGGAARGAARRPPALTLRTW
jgi:hypothetical protein